MNKITVDDLIVEYMIYKVKHGYEPSFTTGEFINFLLYFESEMTVYDALYDGEKLFHRFFERKNERDWSKAVSCSANGKEVEPHMDMVYSSKDTSYLIKANYKLSDLDSSILNSADSTGTKLERITSIGSVIKKWLLDYPKREINESFEVNSNDLMIGKYIASQIIRIVWEGYIKNQIENRHWPEQCTDIEKYLLEMDLAEIINLKSIKQELMELYNVLSKRIAIMYHQDKNLQISTCGNHCLANANYKLITQGYEEIMELACFCDYGDYKKNLDIDLSTLSFKEIYEIVSFYWWDGVRYRYDEPDVKRLVQI